MKTNHRRILVWAAGCLVGYLAAGKDRVGTTISDTCFLVGIAGLMAGLWKLITRTGFFFIPRYGMRRFLAVVTNRTWSREPMAESYHKHLLSVQSDTSHRSTLLISVALLMASAVFALL